MLSLYCNITSLKCMNVLLANLLTRVGYLAEERHSLHRQKSRIEMQRQKSIKELGKDGSDLGTEAKTFKIKNGGSVDHHEEDVDEDTKKLKGLQLFQSRVLGLLMKRMICTYRRWILFFLIVSRHFLIIFITIFVNFDKNVMIWHWINAKNIHSYFFLFSRLPYLCLWQFSVS